MAIQQTIEQIYRRERGENNNQDDEKLQSWEDVKIIILFRIFSTSQFLNSSSHIQIHHAKISIKVTPMSPILTIPLTVKNAVLTLDRSLGFTSECSYRSNAATIYTPIE